MRGIVLLFSMLLLVPMLVRAQARDDTQERFKALEETHPSVGGLTAMILSESFWRSLKGLPPFSQDERRKSQSRDRVRPRLSPDHVGSQSREGNPGQVAAQSRFDSVGFERRARSENGEFALLAGEPRHNNGREQQQHDPNNTGLSLAISQERQN